MPLAMRFLTVVSSWVALVAVSHAAPPRTILEEYELQQVAREPEIVTPVALAFDQSGALLVIESHTHQRPADYAGPSSDRIRRLADTDGDGQFDTWSTFAEGFRHAMNVVVRDDGAVVVVTRGDVFLLHDRDDDSVADDRQTLVHLETRIDYPHNCAGRICFRWERWLLPRAGRELWWRVPTGRERRKVVC